MVLQYYKNDILENMLSQREFKPFPNYKDRTIWEKEISVDFKNYIINEAERYLDYQWPYLPATHYLDFHRNGNRARYESNLFNNRRYPLMNLVLAECFEGKGRFMNDILNGIWTTLEESSWVVPAHNRQVKDLSKNNYPLPDAIDKDNIYIDLFAAETSAILSWSYYLIGESLPKEAFQIPERMLYELDKRIITPYLKNSYKWMGFDGTPVNNWNPWITSNVLTTASLICKDEEKRKAVVSKALDCLQYFIDGYTEDGGCEEGPGYWTAAGACLYDCLDIIKDLTNGRVDLCNESIIKNICSYIYKMQISPKYFINYADAAPSINPDSTIIYRMGKHSGDQNMIKMGIALYNKQIKDKSPYKLNGCDGFIYRYTKNLLINKELSKEKLTTYPLIKDVWFNGIEVMASRENEGSANGLFLSAKGGHNGESHNHNDIGSFIIYYNGKPAIIDIGTGVYEKKTFSDQRYEIPQMQSLYHNLPIIDGIGEMNGSEFRSKNVSYKLNNEKTEFSLDISSAYTMEANVIYWNRSFEFLRNEGKIILKDKFKLYKESQISFVFLTPTRPINKNNILEVILDEGLSLKLHYSDDLELFSEAFDTSKDANLKNNWGNCIYRNILKIKYKTNSGTHTFTFTK